MSEGYQSVDSNEVDTEVNQVRDALEALVSEGARRMLESAMEEEVSAFLGRDRYQRGSEFRGYRNGYHHSREITVGLNPLFEGRFRGCHRCLLKCPRMGLRLR